ncbi:MAG: 30S ribosomal protein S2 [Candidatus Sumerlaeota bacterium]
MMQPVTMKQLLEAGVHFGHQKRRWNPKMKKYIYTDRNDIYIVDLKKTLKLLREACVTVREIVAAGGRGMFVGTKKQAAEAIQHWAEQSGQYYINYRWLGGMMTNWQTVSKRVRRLQELEAMFETGDNEKYSKKEQAMYMRELNSLKRSLDGVKGMRELPAFLFVIDPEKEDIAVAEANKLKIPVIAVVDTNCDPDPVDHVIPGNDDAIRAINLVCQKIAESCIDGMIQRVDAGLEPPSFLPESIRQQVMGTVVEHEEVPETEKPEVVVEQEAAPQSAPAQEQTEEAPSAPPQVEPPTV